jgi:hypothetical protein
VFQLSTLGDFAPSPVTAPDFSSFGLALNAVAGFRGWFHSPVVDDWQQAKKLAARLRAYPEAEGFGVLVGMRGGDSGHRIYITPSLNARELVESFSVGEVGGEPLVARTAARLAGVERICPLVVTFADGKGLHAEFLRRLDQAAAARIEALWSFDDAYSDGLESYVSDWIGEGPLMAPRLVEEQGLQLWWD